MRTIFEQFGPVLDVVARKTYRLRGQAWVVFETAEDADKAVKLLQGFPFYSKQLVGVRPGLGLPPPGRVAPPGGKIAGCSFKGVGSRAAGPAFWPND